MIFYVGLILFQVPGCLGYRVFPPSKVRDLEVYLIQIALTLLVDRIFCLLVVHCLPTSDSHGQPGRLARVSGHAGCV